MGYSTSYKGKVVIHPVPTAPVLVALKDSIEEADNESSYSLEIGNDFSSIIWQGNEKTRDFEQSLNAVECDMQNKGFDFTLVGEFDYQGEESEDRGYIRKVDGKFVRVEKAIEKDEYKCPDCGHIFKP